MKRLFVLIAVVALAWWVATAGLPALGRSVALAGPMLLQWTLLGGFLAAMLFSSKCRAIVGGLLKAVLVLCGVVLLLGILGGGHDDDVIAAIALDE